MMTHVYFTVDTESSMNGAWRSPQRYPLEASRHVFCRIGNEEFGIPLLTRIMGAYGFRATYFIETLATECLGEPDTRSIFDFLLQQGQDVQLHIHPTFHYYAEYVQASKEGKAYRVPEPNDLIGRFPEQVQTQLLTKAAAYFEQFAGFRATAFRAGCYAASLPMMRCLSRMGISVDSSFNPSFHPAVSFPDAVLEPNAVQKVEGVWEVPVTVARTRLPEGGMGFKFADCTSLSFIELRGMLEAAARGGQEHVVFVFHSFSAVKPKDETYTEMKPNRIVIRRVEKLFRYLAENNRIYEVATMGDLSRNTGLLEKQSGAVIADLGIVTAAIRKAVQAINNAYWV